MRFLLLFLICLTAQARAQFNWLDQAFLAQGPNATVLATGPVSGGTDYALFNGAITTNGATFFTATATGTADFCDVRIKRLGSPTGTITAQVWTYNSGSQQAGSAVGTPSSGISAASISTSYSLVRFTGMSASITSGTSYCLTLTSTEVVDASNEILWDYNNSAPDFGHFSLFSWGAGGPGAGNKANPGQMMFTLYQ